MVARGQKPKLSTVSSQPRKMPLVGTLFVPFKSAMFWTRSRVHLKNKRLPTPIGCQSGTWRWSEKIGKLHNFLSQLHLRFPIHVQENVRKTRRSCLSPASDSFKITVLWTKQYQHTLVAAPSTSEPILSESQNLQSSSSTLMYIDVKIQDEKFPN